MPETIRLDFLPPDADDLVALHIYESATALGTFTEIERVTTIGGFPEWINEYTSYLATSSTDWFKIAWEDGAGHIGSPSAPIQGGTKPSEIMATVDDINANLPKEVVKADYANTALIQISVARVIRGYLSRVIDNGTLVGWGTPAQTPEIIREAAAKIIAGQFHFNEIGKQSLEIEERNFGQLKYNEGMAILQSIIDGQTDVPGVITTNTEAMTDDDYWPVDSTDRSFTKSQLF